MKQLIRIAMCLLLLGFGVERAIDGKKLFAADPKAGASATASGKPSANAKAKPIASKKPTVPKKASGQKVDAKGALGSDDGNDDGSDDDGGDDDGE